MFLTAVQTPSPLELTRAAGVALQQTDNGRVTLGAFNEFFQGQFACRMEDRRNRSQPTCTFCALPESTGMPPRQGRPLWSKSSLPGAGHCLGPTHFTGTSRKMLFAFTAHSKASGNSKDIPGEEVAAAAGLI